MNLTQEKTPRERLSIEELLGDSDGAFEPRELHREAARMTRRKLLLAAAKCFAGKGYQRTTTREIASRAGVTLGALYHHFKGKKELLVTLNRSRQVASLQIMRDALEGAADFFTALRKAAKELFELLSDNPILRGVTREYMGMAMTDPDVKRMHARNDVEFRDLYSEELKRRYPTLPQDRQFFLVHMILVAFEGLMTAVVVDSPMAEQPERILASFVEAFRSVVDD
jgi:AcrR family transcriptional regulator